MTPLELVDHALKLLVAQDMAGFAGLWAADGTAEFPFAPDGYPQRLEGREAVIDYLRDYPEKLDVRSVVSQSVHQTTDPEVVIAEFETEAVVVASGKTIRPRYIAVVRVREGEIQSYRDYWNPVVALEVFSD
jgi:ketosteroid isomerase-like protein